MLPQPTKPILERPTQASLERPNPNAPPRLLLTAARRCAMRELALAPGCACCESLQKHMLRSFGSTLFFDDDPKRLWMALDPKDRSLITPRLVAACIVLAGRARETLFPMQPAPTWPALQLLISPPSLALGADGLTLSSLDHDNDSAAPELLYSIHRLIADAQQRSALQDDARVQQAVDYLWAAADLLERISD